MNLFLEIFLFYLPLIFATVILGFLNKKIKWYFFLVAILAGMIAIIPSTLIQYFVPNFLGFHICAEESVSLTLLAILANCFIINGLIEECMKSACLTFCMPKNFSIKEFFILSIIAGISFATFENVIYIICGMENPQLRMITSSLAHIICTSIDGLFIWLCFQKKCKISLIITSILVHTFYNFFAQLPSWFWVFSIVVLFFGLFKIIIFYQSFMKETN